MDKEPSGAVLDRLLEPVTECFTLETAKALSEMRGDPLAEERVQELAEKCNQGQLSAEERREYEVYVHAENLIGILQAKARLLLKKHADA